MIDDEESKKYKLEEGFIWESRVLEDSREPVDFSLFDIFVIVLALMAVTCLRVYFR